ncbi:MAG: hypothetical protein PHN84_15205 [Desulfuromonadaceae bacterium]|nr:hypothetical protein [Desulfuromonadaceae bacterium]MDD2855960.1 hypothetical protein [Desulfuromonadaceae bacterium]
MSIFIYILLLSFISLSLSGCVKDYSFSRAVYEGVQTRDRLQSAPSERAGKPEPLNYQQYEEERKRQ